MKKTINFAFAFLFLAMSSQAQNNGISAYFQDNLYDFSSLQKVELHNFFSTNRIDLGLTTDDSFAVQHINYTEDKKFDCRYLQYHKGYLVDGTSFVLHGEKNLVLYAAGNQIKNMNVNVTSPISEATALSTVLTAFSSDTFDFQVASILDTLKVVYDDTSYSNFPKGTLVISKAKDSSFEANNYRLTWKFQLNMVFPVDSSITVYVDALTGTVRSTFDRSDYARYNSGTVQTIYNGTRNFRTWACTTCSQWRLMSDVGGDKSIISLVGSTGVLKDADNSWSDYEEQNTTTVHWATERAYNYFKVRHGRIGSDNKGARLENRCNIAGKRYASYSDQGSLDVISVGGRLSGVSPAAMDVLSHEYAHAFIRRNPNLNPYFEDRESGALNEGFADIFGILAERFLLGPMDYVIGNETSSYPSPSIRNFSNPHLSTLTGVTGQAAKYQESGYWDFSNANKHKNAGVVTHWFQLLSQGGTYNGITVPDVGYETADDISFITMMWWLWGSVNFNDTRNQSISATIAHWGKCSKQHKAVVNAWAAVGVGTTAFPACNWAKITGPRVINNTDLQKQVNQKYKLSRIDGEDPIDPGKIIWQIPNNWTTTMSLDNSELTLTSVSDLDSKEIVAIVDLGNNSFDTIKHIVHFVDYEDTTTGEDPSSFMRKAMVDSNNIVSTSDFSIYPNPARNNLNVLIGNDGPATLEIFTITGLRVKSENLKSALSTIDISNFSTGSYILKITSAKSQKSFHFNVNR